MLYEHHICVSYGLSVKLVDYDQVVRQNVEIETWHDRSVSWLSASEANPDYNFTEEYQRHIEQVPPKVIWEECVTLAQLCNIVPIGYNWMPQIYPQNCPFLFGDHHLYLIHLSLYWSPLTIPNGIQIHSAVLPQYTFRTDRLADMWDRRKFCPNTANALLYW